MEREKIFQELKNILKDTVTVEEPPLQRIAVAEDDATSADGSLIVTEVVAVQPLASVTV